MSYIGGTLQPLTPQDQPQNHVTSHVRCSSLCHGLGMRTRCSICDFCMRRRLSQTGDGSLVSRYASEAARKQAMAWAIWAPKVPAPERSTGSLCSRIRLQA